MASMRLIVGMVGGGLAIRLRERSTISGPDRGPPRSSVRWLPPGELGGPVEGLMGPGPVRGAPGRPHGRAWPSGSGSRASSWAWGAPSVGSVCGAAAEGARWDKYCVRSSGGRSTRSRPRAWRYLASPSASPGDRRWLLRLQAGIRGHEEGADQRRAAQQRRRGLEARAHQGRRLVHLVLPKRHVSHLITAPAPRVPAGPGAVV
jgi:hypothetical protein